jgi:hypothetical protein
MKYVADPSILAYIKNICDEVLDESYDPNSVDITTRMFKAIRVIGEIDRITRLLQKLPWSSQIKFSTELDILNNTVKKLSEDTPTSLQFSAYKEPDSVNHPYVKLLRNYLNNGIDLERSIRMVAKTTGVLAHRLKKFYDDNGIDLETLGSTEVVDTAYQSGISSAKIDSSINNMYEQANSKYVNTSEFESFIKGFSSVAQFSEDAIDFEIMKNGIVQYSKSLDTSTIDNLRKYFN